MVSFSQPEQRINLFSTLCRSELNMQIIFDKKKTYFHAIARRQGRNNKCGGPGPECYWGPYFRVYIFCFDKNINSSVQPHGMPSKPSETPWTIPGMLLKFPGMPLNASEAPRTRELFKFDL